MLQTKVAPVLPASRLSHLQTELSYKQAKSHSIAPTCSGVGCAHWYFVLGVLVSYVRYS